MATIDKTTTIANSVYSTKKGPLDAKLTPADTYEELTDLTRIPVAHRYVGLTVTVLNTNTTKIPVEYWLVGGRTNASWKIKTGNIIDTKAHLNALSSSACTVGLEMVVQEDESNDGKLTKYWVTAIENGVVTWERKEYGANVKIEGEDQEE